MTGAGPVAVISDLGILHHAVVSRPLFIALRARAANGSSDRLPVDGVVQSLPHVKVAECRDLDSAGVNFTELKYSFETALPLSYDFYLYFGYSGYRMLTGGDNTAQNVEGPFLGLGTRLFRARGPDLRAGSELDYSRRCARAHRRPRAQKRPPRPSGGRDILRRRRV